MTITVVAYAELKEYLGRSGITSLEVDGGTTLGEVIQKLGLPEELIMSIVCEQKLEGLDSTVKDGCVYQILPLIGSG